MFTKIVTALSVVAAIIVGSLLAIRPAEEAAAASENLLLRAGTFASNDYFCFGDAGGDNGWHGPNNTAADVWPDSSGPCGNQGSTAVWFDSYGKTTAYSTYWLLGEAYDPGFWTNFYCSSVIVPIYWWDGSWVWQGTEWYIHTTPDLPEDLEDRQSPSG
jgi:hypothetical protein